MHGSNANHHHFRMKHTFRHKSREYQTAAVSPITLTLPAASETDHSRADIPPSLRFCPGYVMCARQTAADASTPDDWCRRYVNPNERKGAGIAITFDFFHCRRVLATAGPSSQTSLLNIFLLNTLKLITRPTLFFRQNVNLCKYTPRFVCLKRVIREI